MDFPDTTGTTHCGERTTITRCQGVGLTETDGAALGNHGDQMKLLGNAQNKNYPTMTNTLGNLPREKQLIREWGNFLSIDWTSFCTFTAYHRLTLTGARMKMEKMKDSMLVQYPEEFKIFWVAEPFAGRHDYHVHALIKLPNTIINQKQVITESWHKISPPAGFKKHGRVDVEKYEPARGARYYLAKYLCKDNVDYDLH